MRLTILCLIISAFTANAFITPLQTRAPTHLKDIKSVGDLCDDVVGKTEKLLGKIDEFVLKRAMRLVNHAPALYTLKELGTAAGSSKYGIDAAASALAIAAPSMLSVPAWTGNVLRVVCIAQIASIAKSVLATDDDELWQSDIAATTAANLAFAKVITSATPLRYMALTSVVSGYSARSASDSKMNIHNAAMQILSSFTAVATILGAVNALPAVVPILSGQPEIIAGLGLAGYYTAATRGANSTTKKVINAGVIGAILYGKIAGGALSLTMSNLLQFGTLVTVGTAYVAYGAVMKAKEALA